MPQFEDMTIFTGNANPALAEAVASHLHMSLGNIQVFEFTNENIFVKIDESVRENDVFIVQPFTTPVHRSIMELLIMIDAAAALPPGVSQPSFLTTPTAAPTRKTSPAFRSLPDSLPT